MSSSALTAVKIFSLVLTLSVLLLASLHIAYLLAAFDRRQAELSELVAGNLASVAHFDINTDKSDFSRR